ncbi:hypothetical protein BLOT_002998 [Blomia tropicalis]|nr:hypothetical protein BLOT_002998 [Blomia tropicalis]
MTNAWSLMGQIASNAKDMTAHEQSYKLDSYLLMSFRQYLIPKMSKGIKEGRGQYCGNMFNPTMQAQSIVNV